MWRRKRRYLWPVSSPPYTVLTQFRASFDGRTSRCSSGLRLIVTFAVAMPVRSAPRASKIPSAPIAPLMVWPKRRGDNPSKIRSPTIVPMRTPTVATIMGAQSVSSRGADLMASNGVIRLPIPNPTTDGRGAGEDRADEHGDEKHRAIYRRPVTRECRDQRAGSKSSMDFRPDPRFEFGDHRGQFPSRCENEVPPSSVQR